MSKSRGKLEIPKDAQPLYVEPAIVVKVKQRKIFTEEKFLFAKPPKHPKANYEKISKASELPIGLPGQQDSTGIEELKGEIELTPGRQFTVIKKKAKADNSIETWIIDESFDKSQEILARPFVMPSSNPSENKPHSFLLQVATFEKTGKKIADLPESGKGIKILKTGYMYADDVTYSSETFKKFEGNLFNHYPAATDVVQSGMGDCFVLSAVLSILKQDGGDDFIMNMMKQQDDGTTIVRLYDPRTNPPTPIYVRVENSIHYVEGESAVTHKEFWVHILEKAYAGFGFKQIWDEAEKKEKIQLSHQSFLDIYGEGGHPEVALTILTGVPAKRVMVAQKSSGFAPKNPFGSDQLLIAMSTAHSYNIEPDQVNHSDTSKKIAAFGATAPLINALDKNVDLVAAWGNYIQFIHDNSYDHGYKKFKEICSNSSNTTNTQKAVPDVEPQTVEEVTGLIDRLRELGKIEIEDPLTKSKKLYPPPENVLQKFRETMLKKVAEKQIDNETIPIHSYSGRVGTGYYTAAQYKLFETLFELHQKDHVLTAGTFSDFKGKFEEKEKVIGLRNKHAYAITDVHIKKLHDGTQLLMVRLRNPWGSTGRVYDFANDEDYQKKGMPSCAREEKGIPEFDIDIVDFMRYFESYEVDDFALACKQQAKENRSKWQTTMPTTTANRDRFLLNLHTNTAKQKDESADSKTEKVAVETKTSKHSHK